MVIFQENVQSAPLNIVILAPPARGAVTYRPEVDGLRAVAVLPVLLFHAGLPWLSGGFVGVDVFFVISGFLITGIIHREMEAGHFSLIHFYERRIRRIIPALLAVIAVSSVVAAAVMLPTDLASYTKSAIAALLSFSNISFMREVGYFQTEADLKPLLHTWSLGVEEQFYLFFPPVLMGIHRWCRALLVPFLYVSLVVSLAGCIVLTMYRPADAFYFSPTRAWELMIGAALAVGGLPAVRTVLIREALSLIGVLGIATAMFLFTPASKFPGILAALPCVGAALIIHCAAGTTVGRILAMRGLVFVGMISYSLYLWHWPVLAFERYMLIRPMTAVEALAGMLAAGGLATLSWRYVETPFRKKTTLPNRRALFGAAAAATAVVVGGLAVPFATGGLPSRMSAEVTLAAAGRSDMTEYRDRCIQLPVDEFRNGHPCLLGTANHPSVVLWGDSHADAISPAVDRAGHELNIAVVNASHISCPPILGVEVYEAGETRNCRAWNDAVLDVVRNNPRLQTVVLSARWAAYAHGRGYGADGSKTVALSNDNRRSVLEGFEATLRSLAGRRIVVVLSVPETPYDVPSALARVKRFGSRLELEPTAAQHALRQSIVAGEITRLAQQYGAEVLDPAAVFCSLRCAVSTGNIPLYYDNHHLSVHGALRLSSLFTETLRRAPLTAGESALAWAGPADNSGLYRRP